MDRADEMAIEIVGRVLESELRVEQVIADYLREHFEEALKEK